MADRETPAQTNAAEPSEVQDSAATAGTLQMEASTGSGSGELAATPEETMSAAEPESSAGLTALASICPPLGSDPFAPPDTPPCQ